MEYASEALGWLKKRADVAADRYKRCPAGDPSSIAYGVTAKALQLAVEELGPLVHPAVSECIKPMLIPRDLERLFPAEQSQTEEDNGFWCSWIKTHNAHVVEASRDLRWLIGVRTANSECKVHAYSSLAFAEKLLPALVHSDDRVLVQRGLIDMASKLNLASDKRLAVWAGLLRPMDE